MPQSKDEQAIKKSLLNLKLSDDKLKELLESHKSKYPAKHDYGLGQDGYTLNDSEEIKKFYEDLGVKTWASKNPRTRVDHYKQCVKKVVDSMIECLNGEDSYLGKSCFHTRISELIKMTQADWLEEMQGNFYLVNPMTPSQSQIKAWRKCFSELKREFKNHPEFHNLEIIFEYVISGPWHKSSKANAGSKGKRPDVIIFSKTAVAVVEFKGYDLKAALSQGVDKECANYATKIQEKHIASQELRVGSILVLERENQLLKSQRVKRRNPSKQDIIWCCSPDNICNALTKVLGRHPKRYSDTEKWLNSSFLT